MQTARLLAKSYDFRFPEQESPRAHPGTGRQMLLLFLQRASRPGRQRRLSPRGGPGSIDRNTPSTAQMILQQVVVTTTCRLGRSSQTNWSLKSEALESRSEFATH